MDPVRLALIGAGDRGTSYARWALAHPDRARIVAVAEPDPDRRERLAAAHGIPEAGRHPGWAELLADPGLGVDAVVITTQDTGHADPAVAAARRGLHIMLEKPLAPTPEECVRIVDAVHEAGVMLAVCHVLRYAPYTRLVKQLIDGGAIGEVVSVQHHEPVGFWHQAHSFVRGNWRREDLSSFMLLAKSCHDIDWLQHVVGRDIARVSSFGGLRHFRPENRPAGAADRCLECAVEPDCPYSAPRLYLDQLARGEHAWPLSVVTPVFTEEALTAALREGPYGRCVYACDNDVVDHQVVAIEFDGGVSAAFTMNAFNTGGHRRTRIFGTRGELVCDGPAVTVHDFVTGTATSHDAAAAGGADAAGGHGGGDAGLMEAFTAAVATGDRSGILSGPEQTLNSHLATFAAERARREGTVVTVARP
ncbi:putative dehydrogenase [Allocatelliglobosispora scoriae]|uniref:Putative dehydrogenase n=1 Tax=Allocatelliglobosispora scoriae TaxID=643052 RepID=A0A841BLJ6_9ACTN|nr:Gfo/Idh/MocA family oxidoreductase [Allocatelliglobosispora scoriae]MBB5868126.1 putative dehydrogenase [Allocatelliglobosispora scoriae]